MKLYWLLEAGDPIRFGDEGFIDGCWVPICVHDAGVAVAPEHAGLYRRKVNEDDLDRSQWGAT